MAIKIPSKNIYEMENPKVRDNVIDNVSVEQTVIAPDNEFNISVYNKNIKNIITEQTNSDPSRKDISTIVEMGQKSVQGGVYLDYFVCSHTEYNTYKKSQTFSIKIPKIKNNSFVEKIYYGKDDNGYNNIKYTLIGKKRTGNATATVSYSTGILGVSNINIGTIQYGNFVEGDSEKFEINKEETYTYDYTESFNGVNVNGTATSKAYFYNDSTIFTATPSDYVENGIEYYLIQFNITCGVKVVKMGGGSVDYESTSVSGTYEEYVPTEVEITIYGNTAGISLTDGSITYIKDDSGNTVKGVGNKPHSLIGNELLQDSATTNSNLTTKELAKNILTQYEKGKETATLLCDINEYYDENDQLKISVKNNGLPMTFKIGDEVIPMTFSKDRKDVPMSKYKNGNPKVFKIVGVEKIYDGAVWQKLYMQEK